MEHDPEIEAVLAAWAAIRRWGRRAVTFGWAAMTGRAAVATMAFAIWFALAVFARPPVPDLPKARVNFAQAWTVDGRPVDRQEWTDRALAGL